ncbi:sensor histidine kinase [Actinobacteria bacterium YIM 96077]|uniref:histidine kinase n=1 Tax=Phytoactinopolyspora halophila TaxID=1981511 RepID=A0A329QB80_9ACTN|nr:HAMP domain-containing sensor histidine kinase [Phytoactinopolyspora halophila]AYY14145.1 sensor histidine kinase [Actinobacteria bacterium YIM 96077]RAW09606.1 sensor histidine kinase [Phytoactinopolyspora halophila]
MTLRARLAILTSAAVALAILAASVAAWLLIRSTLLSDVDQRLLDRMPDIERISEMTRSLDDAEQTTRASVVLQGEPIGVQRVESDGRIVASVPPGDVALTFDPDERALLEGDGDDPVLRTETIDGASYRVMSAALSGDMILRMVHPLHYVGSTMTRMTWLLVGVASVGVAFAGGLGWVITRAGLRPVDELADSAEQVAATKDLAYRIETDGRQRDEVARLADSINAMLAALDSARTEQRQLVENAGHELRTPLATLRNDLGLLLRAEQHPERSLDATDRERLLHDLESEAAALSDLVGELVELARGGIEPEPLLETDLRALVDRAVTRNRRVSPRVTVTVHGPSFEAPVRPAMLERAVTNLVRNAVQVSEEGGLVEVQLDEAGAWVSICVFDSGPGISNDDMPHLFDRFYRGENARERHGSGLGLAIVAQAAEQHGGSVEAANRPRGGAAFTLRVPSTFSGSS